MNTILQASPDTPGQRLFQAVLKAPGLKTVHLCSVCLGFWSGSVDSTQKKADLETT